MLIKTSVSFLHGRTRFEAGTIYDLPDAFGGYFVGVGWAQVILELPPGEKAHAVTVDMLGSNAPPEKREGSDLEIQDVNLGTSST